MSVSDRLTEIAEIIVECALQSAWRQMTAQLGTPRYLDEGGLQGMQVLRRADPFDGGDRHALV